MKMKLNRNPASFAMAALAVFASAAWCHAVTIPVTNWAVHNQLGAGTPGVTDAGTNSPTFDVDGDKDNAVVMGTFPGISLANDGDYVKLSTTLTMTDRSALTGVNALNINLRLGLYNGPAGAVAAQDIPNIGLYMPYANAVAAQVDNRYIRAQDNATLVNPFDSPVASNIVQGTVTSTSIQGANPGPVLFELTLTRNAGLMDIVGKVSGTDSGADQAPFLLDYAISGYDASAIGFTFNRAGFFFGQNVNSPSALLADVVVETNVPEPSSCIVAAVASIGLAAAGRAGRRSRRLAQPAR